MVRCWRQDPDAVSKEHSSNTLIDYFWSLLPVHNPLWLFIVYPDLELLRIARSHQFKHCPVNIKAYLFGKYLQILLFLQTLAEKFDRCHHLLFGQLPACAIDAMKCHLIPVLLQWLVDEGLKFLLVAQLRQALGDGLWLRSVLLLVLDLPEPLVDLVLSHVELWGQLNSQLSRRHLALMLLEDLPKHVHLLRLLTIAAAFSGLWSDLPATFTNRQRHWWFRRICRRETTRIVFAHTCSSAWIFALDRALTKHGFPAEAVCLLHALCITFPLTTSSVARARCGSWS